MNKQSNEYELRFNYNSLEDYDVFLGSSFALLLEIARGFINRWHIVRLADGREIAMSYDGNTPVERAARNRRD